MGGAGLAKCESLRIGPDPATSNRANHPPHPDQLLPPPRRGNLISRRHPHQGIHLHAKRLLNAQRHIPGQAGVALQHPRLPVASRREAMRIAPDGVRGTASQYTRAVLEGRHEGHRHNRTEVISNSTRTALLHRQRWPTLNLYARLHCVVIHDKEYPSIRPWRLPAPIRRKRPAYPTPPPSFR